MNSRAPKTIDQQVIWEAQAIVMEVLNCNSTTASEVIRKQAAWVGSMTDAARRIVDGGVANFQMDFADRSSVSH